MPQYPIQSSVAVVPYNTRKMLTDDATYYVAIGGSDEGGGSAASPWATLQHAVDYCAHSLDLNGEAVYILLGPGTFEGARIPLTSGAGYMQINGAGSALTTITGGIVFPYGEIFYGINFATFVPSLDQSALNSSGYLTVGDTYGTDDADVVIDTINKPLGCIFASGGRLVMGTGTITIKQHGGVFAGISLISPLIAYYQTYVTNYINWVFTGPPDTWAYFLRLANGSGFDAQFFSSTGAMNGKRYHITISCWVATYGSGVSGYPGSVAGTADASCNIDGVMGLSVVSDEAAATAELAMLRQARAQLTQPSHPSRLSGSTTNQDHGPLWAIRNRYRDFVRIMRNRYRGAVWR